MITGWDHFIAVVNELDHAIQTFRRLGFQVSPGGEHRQFGSHNALVPLADASYIELVAFKDRALAAATFWGDAVRKLEVGEGWASYALASGDLASVVEQIRRRGLPIQDPQSGSRLRPDGELVGWRTAVVGGTPAGYLPFLIQDETAPKLRRLPAKEGLGSRVRPKEIIVAVKNVEVARQAYRELLDIEPRFVQNTAGDLTGYRVNAGWGSLILAHPERKSTAMSDQLGGRPAGVRGAQLVPRSSAGRGEGLFALTLTVDDVNRARAEITRLGVRVEDDSTGFMILPEGACGARIRLVQA